MGLLDAKAAARTRANRKAVDTVSAPPVARSIGKPPLRARGLPNSPRELATRERGKPQADRAAVVRAKVRDQVTIRTVAPGFELGLEVLKATVARWPQAFRDEWEERAAILEYDAGESRPVAERRAYKIVRQAHEAALLMAEAEQ